MKQDDNDKKRKLEKMSLRSLIKLILNASHLDIEPIYQAAIGTIANALINGKFGDAIQAAEKIKEIFEEKHVSQYLRNDITKKIFAEILNNKFGDLN